jgi:hypothetical protein
MVDIFAEGSSSQVSWAKFQTIGDKVQGTYIGSYKAINKFNQSQTIYQLLDENGGVVNVGVLDSKKALHAVMDHVFLGQDIGFKYTEDRPSKNGTNNATKIIAVWQNPKIVNQEWIDRQKELGQLKVAENAGFTSPVGAASVEEGDDDVEDDEDESTEGGDGWGAFGSVTPAAPDLGVDKLQRISDLAAQKLGVSGDASIIKDKVMEATGLAFIPVNYDQIISALEAL